VLIFSGDRLIRSSVEGTQVVKEVQDQNLLPALIRRGIGFAF
jgi:hypothetical protein